MATYKTPDVYVEEISIFPPSIAEVESAVPCFIGHTEKATKIVKGDLLNKAQKVSSMVEFERYYGEAPPLVSDYSDPNDRIEVTLDENNNPQSVKLEPKFYLYDSLKLFFDNGGGKCYIISVGDYQNTPSYGDETTEGTMRYGLEVLRKLDEPTIICFPDAVLLSGNSLYDLQVQALRQCGNLMDRVLICDLMNSGDHDSDVDDFRGRIGINNLKYGAAYTPWLKTSLTKSVQFRDILLKRSGGSTVLLENLTKDTGIKSLIALIRLAVAATDDISADIIDANRTDGTDTFDSIMEHFQAKVDDYDEDVSGFTTIGDFRTALRTIYTIIVELSKDLFVFGGPLADSGDWKLKTNFDDIVSDCDLETEMQKLLYHSNAFDATSIITPGTFTTDIQPYYSGSLANTGDGGSIDAEYAAAADNAARGELAKAAAIEVIDAFNDAVNELLKASKSYESTFEDSLREAFGSYKTIIQKIDETLSEVPPSGAIAGIYSFIDRTRGVHKAPANVSLSSVQGLTADIDFEGQKDLNVDTNAGKSINAIRSFTGKGILVWGARTLAGNDNEWRYIPVRRFFNMVEESVKKSTYWAVFEPNDANLWVKVKGMIENYLFLKWRDGALAGATPEDAYFVKVGLGLTMTPQDILEGRLNVEIGMAVVRPAEFIILKFSHKMQQS